MPFFLLNIRGSYSKIHFTLLPHDAVCSFIRTTNKRLLINNVSVFTTCKSSTPRLPRPVFDCVGYRFLKTYTFFLFVYNYKSIKISIFANRKIHFRLHNNHLQQY
jgi:hypothetical protein